MELTSLSPWPLAPGSPCVLCSIASVLDDLVVCYETLRLPHNVSDKRRGCWRRSSRWYVFVMILLIFGCWHLLIHITEHSEGKLFYCYDDE